MICENWLYEHLGTEWCGNVHAPGDHIEMARKADDCPPVIHTSEDGFTLWFGTEDKWYMHMRAPESRRLAWFILWRWWVVGTWCGLRRAIWFKLLNRRVRAFGGPREGAREEEQF